MNELITQLYEAGLVQFGAFEGAELYKLNLQWLPSYPLVLHACASAAKAHTSIPPTVERLLCRTESLPFALTLGLSLNIPIVYSRGEGQSPVYDLVGAYDIGHPTLYVTHIWEDSDEDAALLQRARGVGLDIIGVLALIGMESSVEEALPVQIVLSFAALLEQLVAAQQLPIGQAEAVYARLHERKR